MTSFRTWSFTLGGSRLIRLPELLPLTNCLDEVSEMVAVPSFLLTCLPSVLRSCPAKKFLSTTTLSAESANVYAERKGPALPSTWQNPRQDQTDDARTGDYASSCRALPCFLDILDVVTRFYTLLPLK
ncbi:hypothetical protein KPH14_007102 [Odynerus spinipes]|uniref:Uncharacterized protein n=1 Tax=Odynerus spinipes TaxID=1348599 RepID=A0AAD9RSW5_9HYME|nr:hypothetical protein KPH14_007102 [Odynerus spinipes]